MAENNNSLEMDNTDTGFILLEKHVSSTPRVAENKMRTAKYSKRDQF